MRYISCRAYWGNIPVLHALKNRIPDKVEDPPAMVKAKQIDIAPAKMALRGGAIVASAAALGQGRSTELAGAGAAISAL